MGNKNKVLLKDICNVITKGTTPSQFSEKGINFIRIENINGLNIDSNFDMFISEKIHVTDLKRSILKKNDILFAIAGATVGKCAIVNEDCLPANTNQALAIIRLKNNYDSFYIANILASEKMKKYIYLNISVGAQPNLSLEQIGNFQFYVDDIVTQTKIATFLNLYYKKIELQRNKVKKFINFKHHVVKSVINNKGDKYQLCELCQINKGQQLNKLNMLEYGQYKVYNGGISYSGYTNKFNTNENTISISEGGNSCGFVNFINEKFWSGGHNYTLSNLKINTKYLYFILKSCQEDIMKLRVGSGLPNIQKSALEKFQVFIKKNNLSRNLCLFELLEKKNVLEQQKLELLEKYKQGLLQKMFI